MLRKIGLKARAATLKKTLIAERKEHPTILSSCRKLIDDAVGVDFSGAEAALGKIRVVRGIWEILRLKA